MRAVFVEASDFTRLVNKFLSDETYAKLQQELMNNPNAGDAIPGCGGLRKVRIGDSRRAKGKRSGARVIYLYLPEVKRFYMLDIYGKNEKDDLSPQEKKALTSLAAALKRRVQKLD